MTTVDVLRASIGAGVACWALLSCTDGIVAREVDCFDSLDDDGDGAIDCQDQDCAAAEPACQEPDDDPIPDAGADGDGDVDADGDTAGDGEPDGSFDDGGGGEDADDGSVLECSRDSDCQLALDMLECCGGAPHWIREEITACPSAQPRVRVANDLCVVPWYPGELPPFPPEECLPLCDASLCNRCADVARAACREGRCVGVATSEGCHGDDDCHPGQTCADLDLDGVAECGPGEHQCATPQDCRAANADCAMCECMDFGGDGVRVCRCHGCEPRRCTHDFACDPHHFCIDGECAFAGETACRMFGSPFECPRCNYCVYDGENPFRGTCMPDGDSPDPSCGSEDLPPAP